MTEDITITKLILNYLQEHPAAGDNLEGIAQWWSLRQHVCESVRAVQQALEELKQQGVIVEQKGADGRSFYTLRQH